MVSRRIIEQAESYKEGDGLPDYCPSCGSRVAHVRLKGKAARCAYCDAPLTGTADWLETELPLD